MRPTARFTTRRKTMKKERIYLWSAVLFIFAVLPTSQALADGGYVSSSQSVALSADQRAIIIQNGNEISMTFSTGYTGGGEDFGWIIPTPIPPAIEDVREAGKNGEGLAITSLSRRHEKTEVYHIEVESYHNYAVNRIGILVHNGGKQETAGKAESESQSLVTVYGQVTLEHFEVSVLGAADASALLNWFQNNNYLVNPAAHEVLNTYIGQQWAFVAVKLNPSEKRHYENEFLPPLTIKYRHDELVFPLRISSVSTTRAVKITLYVIAESNVSSSNFPTTNLKYDESLSEVVDPEKYIEACIQNIAGAGGGKGFVVIWSGELAPWVDQQIGIDLLPKASIQKNEEKYLTRIEARMEPTAMTEDIAFSCNPIPKVFRVSIFARKGGKSASAIAKLIAATQVGEIERVKELLDAGISSNTANSGGVTPLMKASGSGHIEIAHILLQAGARVDMHDRSGRTALMNAALYGGTEIVQLLLQAGSEVNDKSKDGKTTLIFAAEEGHTEIVKLLLKARADVNTRDNYGNTALIWAAPKGHSEVVQMQLRAGADTNHKNKTGVTALMRAARNGHTQVVKTLLGAGADVNEKDIQGKTALIYAKRNRQIETIDLLTKAGAEE